MDTSVATQQQAHQHGGHHEVAHGGVSGLARVGEVGVHIGRQCALLGRQVHHLARGAEAPQQRIHRERHDAQHHDLAKSVKAPEVHQHHVDHVGAAPFSERTLQEEGGGAVGERAAHHRKRQQRHACARAQRQCQVAPAAITDCP